MVWFFLLVNLDNDVEFEIVVFVFVIFVIGDNVCFVVLEYDGIIKWEINNIVNFGGGV